MVTVDALQRDSGARLRSGAVRSGEIPELVLDEYQSRHPLLRSRVGNGSRAYPGLESSAHLYSGTKS